MLRIGAGVGKNKGQRWRGFYFCLYTSVVMSKQRWLGMSVASNFRGQQSAVEKNIE